jgi:hypothetical protein
MTFENLAMKQRFRRKVFFKLVTNNNNHCQVIRITKAINKRNKNKRNSIAARKGIKNYMKNNDNNPQVVDQEMNKCK